MDPTAMTEKFSETADGRDHIAGREPCMRAGRTRVTMHQPSLSSSPLRAAFAVVPLVAAALLGACSNSNGGSGGKGGSAGSAGEAGAGAGDSGGTGGTGGSAPQTARDFFQQVVYPAMTMSPDGCDGCHSLGGAADLPFLGNPKGEPSPYDAISTWPGIVVKDPNKSVLVVHASQESHGKGQAPIISESLKQKCLEWLAMEAKNLPDAKGNLVYSVKPFKPILFGALNTIYLDSIDPSLANASISFNARELDTNLLQLKNLEVHPVEGQSIHVVHPLFTVYPQQGDPMPDPVDSFSGVDQTFTLDNPVVELGTGELILTDWQKDAYLGIAFEDIKNTSGGGPATGCTDVKDFKSMVVPQMQYCADNCHGGKDEQAHATMDLSMLDADPPTDACAQVRARITPGDPATSKILIVTDPTQQAVHKYKFMGNTVKYQAFKDAVSPWIKSEAQ